MRKNVFNNPIHNIFHLDLVYKFLKIVIFQGHEPLSLLIMEINGGELFILLTNLDRLGRTGGYISMPVS